MYECGLCHKEYSSQKRYLTHLEKCGDRHDARSEASVRTSRSVATTAIVPPSRSRSAQRPEPSIAPSSKGIEKITKEKQQLKAELKYYAGEMKKMMKTHRLQMKETEQYYQEQIDSLVEERDALNEELSGLNDEMFQEKERIRSEMNEKIAAERAKVEKRHGGKSSAQLTKLSANNEKLQKRLSEQMEQNSLLRDEMEQEMVAREEEYRVSIDALEESLMASQQEVSSLKLQSSKRIKDMEAEISRLKKTNAREKKERENKTQKELEEHRAHYESEIESLQIEVETLEANLVSSKKKIEEQAKSYQKKMENLHQKPSDDGGHTNEINTLRAMLEQAKEENFALRSGAVSSGNSLFMKMEDVDRKLRLKDEDIYKLTKELSDIKCENNSLRMECDDMVNLKLDLDKAREMIKRLRGEDSKNKQLIAQKLNEQKRELEAVIKDRDAKIREVEEDLRRVLVASRDDSNIRSIQAQYERLIAERDRLVEEVNKLSSSLNSAKGERDELKRICEDIRHKYEDINRKYNEKELQITKLKEMSTSLNKKNKELMGSLGGGNDLKKQLEDKELQLVKLKEMVTTLSNKNKELGIKLGNNGTELKKQLETKELQLTKLKELATTLSNQNKAVLMELNKLKETSTIEGVNAQLNKKKELVEKDLAMMRKLAEKEINMMRENMEKELSNIDESPIFLEKVRTIKEQCLKEIREDRDEKIRLQNELDIIRRKSKENEIIAKDALSLKKSFVVNLNQVQSLLNEKENELKDKEEKIAELEKIVMRMNMPMHS